MSPHEPGQRDEHLLSTLALIGETLSLRQPSGDEAEWADALLKLTASHPDPYIRAHLARNASLRQLHELATDPHIAVRLAVADNPFCIDAQLQLTLASDHDASVVHTLLNNVDPYLTTVKVLLASPHATVRRRLARMNLREDLLDYLSLDHDDEVSSAALQTLTQRRQHRLQTMP